MLDQSLAYDSICESIDPSFIGKAINGGTQTVVFKPYYYISNISSIESPVLIGTIETEKFSFLENLFEGTNVKVEKLDISLLSSELAEGFSYLESEGWNFFFSTELKKFELSYDVSEDNHLLAAFEELTLANTQYSSQGFPTEYLINELKDTFKHFHEKNRIPAKVSKIIKAVEDSFQALKKSIYSEFVIDLHDDQFVEYKGKIFCIDPVLYNFKRAY